MPSNTIFKLVDLGRSNSDDWTLHNFSHKINTASFVEDDHYYLISTVAQQHYPTSEIKLGAYSVEPDSHSNDIVPVLRFVNDECIGFDRANSKNLIFLHRSGMAVCPVDLNPLGVFRSTYVSLSFSQEIYSLWTWAYFNSLQENLPENQAALQQIKSCLSGGSIGDLAVPRMRVIDSTLLSELRTLVADVNRSVTFDHVESSHYSKKTLPTDSIWNLKVGVTDDEQEKSDFELGDLLELVVRGNADPKLSPGLLPVANGKWISGSPDLDFVEENTPGLVRAIPGDLVIPVIGSKSKAKVVTSPMAVGRNFFVLRPKSEQSASEIADFLNSRRAGLIRESLVSEGTIMKTLRLDDLEKFPFSPQRNFPRDCRLLIERWSC